MFKLKNKYEISYFNEIPLIDVGGTFIYSDLYELIGKDKYMTTFIFKEGSEASERYGESVTGVIYYSKEELKELDKLTDCYEKNEIKIDSPMDMEQKQREELKYGGILVPDIESISFMPYKRPEEYHDSGEKIVPNVIYIPYEGNENDDYDLLYQNLIVSKINHGTELIQYEKEKFIGITLGVNNGRIDSRILTHLGFDLEKVKSCMNIWYHLYLAKERKNTISEEEKKKLADLKFIRFVDNLKKLNNELIKSGVKSKELSEKSQPLETIILELTKFEPKILLYGKKPIYWDIESYLHIVVRHVKQLQFGNFKTKSSFPYKYKELEALIEQVLRKIEDEIERHFDERPGNDFKRVGKMSVSFNNDYYCVQISQQGRLVNIYINN